MAPRDIHALILGTCDVLLYMAERLLKGAGPGLSGGLTYFQGSSDVTRAADEMVRCWS